MLPILALDAVTSLGAGSATDLGTVASHFSAYVLLQDVANSYPGPTNESIYAQVNLEGSFDNTNWYPLATWAPYPLQSWISSPISGEQFAASITNVSSLMQAQYVRANWVSLTGIGSYATTGTLSVWIGVELPAAGPVSATFSY